MTNHPKRLTAERLAGVPELEDAFSDATDTKDIWGGDGTQPRSVGRHVRLLQESLLAMGYQLPRHGADGIYGDETTAAAMRLQIDAGHPWPAGQGWEHIGGIAGPNTMAHFDMFDPGGTVGSHAPAATVSRPHRAVRRVAGQPVRRVRRLHVPVARRGCEDPATPPRGRRAIR